jgi:transcriptional regulator of NAD metabolism
MSSERRRQILALLQASDTPLTGSELASRFGVSRQVIVHDMAILRAAGEPILATAQGYILSTKVVPRAYREVVTCCHTREQTEAELLALVDAGVKVVDVIVEHPIYGELRGLLMIETRADVQRFIQRLTASGAEPLLTLTRGLHLHTLEASRPENLAAARAALRRLGILVEDPPARPLAVADEPAGPLLRENRSHGRLPGE